LIKHDGEVRWEAEQAGADKWWAVFWFRIRKCEDDATDWQVLGCGCINILYDIIWDWQAEVEIKCYKMCLIDEHKAVRY